MSDDRPLSAEERAEMYRPTKLKLVSDPDAEEIVLDAMFRITIEKIGALLIELLEGVRRVKENRGLGPITIVDEDPLAGDDQ